MGSKAFITVSFVVFSWFLVGADAQRRNFGAVRRCSDPFVFVAGKCFWFYRQSALNTVNRKQALDICAKSHGHLAWVTDTIIHRELRIWIDRHEFRQMSYWIGLSSDKSENDEYRWTGSDDATAFTAWGEGQPNPRIYRACVKMSDAISHNWEAVDCGQRNLFICEKEVESSARGELRAASASFLDHFCDERSLGYYSDPTDCRKYILCFGKNLSRFSCPSNEVFNPLNSMCGTEDRDTLCGTALETTTTTSPVLEATDNPDVDGNDDEDEYYDGDDDYPVDNGCLVDVRDDAELGDFPEYECEDPGYSKLGKKCYKIFYDEPVVWGVANQICIGDEGGKLATIKSSRTQKFLYTELKRNGETMISDYWIGLNDQKTPDTYVWSDRSTLKTCSYQNWSRMAKKRHRHLKKCVQIAMLSKGGWEDSVCANENGYICEKGAINFSMQAIPNTPPTTGSSRRWKSRNLLCGTNRRHNTPMAVVGGRPADMAEHPWQVSLRSFGEHRCGGTLIDNCWVLTAAHCVDIRSTGHSKLPSLVVLGDVDTSVPEGTEKYLRISEVVLHPEWTSRPVPTHDIALLKLGTCVGDLNPICLPGKNFDEFLENKMCKVAGWGTMDAKVQDYPSRLQEANIPLLSQSVCKKKYVLKRNSLIQDGMFCAGYLKGGIDACQGDSGGPLSCKGVKYANHAVQWGIVSWGFGCAGRNRPGVYTKVAHYMEWIRNETMIDF